MPEFIWPDVAPITQGYGLQKDGSFHPGVDIGVPVGSNVLASAVGTVTNAGNIGVGGNTLVIADPSGYETVYADLGALKVKIGDKITQGETIAISDGTKGGATSGTSTGPHVHFQIDQGAGAVHNIDPIPLLPTSTPSTSGAPTPSKAPSTSSSILNDIKNYLIFGVGGIDKKIPVVSTVSKGLSAADTTAKAVDSTGVITSFLSTSSNWKRLGLGVLGAGILIFTVVKLTSDTSTGQMIKGVASKVAVA